ncbi:MAG: hypothetical protein ABI787_04650 [Spartobacteria bacterium]
MMRKTNVRGPSPEEKAKKSLGQKLNRPSKPPPPPPNEPSSKNTKGRLAKSREQS